MLIPTTEIVDAGRLKGIVSFSTNQTPTRVSLKPNLYGALREFV